MVTGRGRPENLTCHLPVGYLAKEVIVWNDFFWLVARGFSGVLRFSWSCFTPECWMILTLVVGVVAEVTRLPLSHHCSSGVLLSRVVRFSVCELPPRWFCCCGSCFGGLLVALLILCLAKSRIILRTWLWFLWWKYGVKLYVCSYIFSLQTWWKLLSGGICQYLHVHP